MKKSLSVSAILTILSVGIIFFCQSAFAASMPAYPDGKLEQHPSFKDVLIASVPDVTSATGSFDVRMNLYKPLNASGRVPLVVFIHGGGGSYNTSGGSRTWNPVVINVLDHGAAIASVGYRTFGGGPMGGPGNAFPNTLHDLRGSIRHLKANADKYGIDPDRIVVIGGSAGGFCSSILFATNGLSTFHGKTGDIDLEGDVGGNTSYSSEVKAVAIYFPITNPLLQDSDWDTELFPVVNVPDDHFRGIFDVDGRLSEDKIPDSELRDYYLKIRYQYPDYPGTYEYAKELDLAVAASSEMNLLLRPENTLDKLPPVFIEHGKMDPAIPVKQGRRLLDAYTTRFTNTKAADDAAVFITNATAGHGGFQGYLTEDAVVVPFVKTIGASK
jgi:acetyl esterase/lipase